MTRTVAGPDVQDIDGVLAALRTVVDDAARAGDRIGLFAAVYRQVTAAIARGLADGHFDDAERLNRFDAVFAGRYLTALEARRDGRDPGRSWRLSFRAAEDTRWTPPRRSSGSTVPSVSDRRWLPAGNPREAASPPG
jgi:hypothetical protein